MEANHLDPLECYIKYINGSEILYQENNKKIPIFCKYSGINQLNCITENMCQNSWRGIYIYILLDITIDFSKTKNLQNFYAIF